MLIFVRGLEEESLLFDIEPSETLKELKSKIKQRNGIPTEFQRLIYSGKELQHENKLQDYGVYKGTTIHLVIRVLGGYL